MSVCFDSGSSSCVRSHCLCSHCLCSVLILCVLHVRFLIVCVFSLCVCSHCVLALTRSAKNICSSSTRHRRHPGTRHMAPGAAGIPKSAAQLAYPLADSARTLTEFTHDWGTASHVFRHNLLFLDIDDPIEFTCCYINSLGKRT